MPNGFLLMVLCILNLCTGITEFPSCSHSECKVLDKVVADSIDQPQTEVGGSPSVISPLNHQNVPFRRTNILTLPPFTICLNVLIFGSRVVFGRKAVVLSYII